NRRLDGGRRSAGGKDLSRHVAVREGRPHARGQMTLASYVAIALARAADRHFVLFCSSHGIGSQSSTLFPSGSRTHANFPFSWDSGPFQISTPFRFSCASISDMLSIR